MQTSNQSVARRMAFSQIDTTQSFPFDRKSVPDFPKRTFCLNYTEITVIRELMKWNIYYVQHVT